MTTTIRSLNLLLNFIIIGLLELQGCVESTIVSSPRLLYVIDGEQGILRCQNRSVDGELYISSLSNAMWYRHHNNGTNITISGTSTVYSRGYALYFNSPLQEDEGYYFCCVPDELCSSIMTAVIISNPPNITAIDTLYTAEVGKDVVLECIIASQGKPLAELSWTKSGVKLDEHTMTRNNSVFIITLLNVTMDDAGIYTCSAVSGNTYRNDHIRLHVEDNHRSEIMQFCIILNEGSCQRIEQNLSETVQHFVQTMYDGTILVNIDEINCPTDSEKKVIFDLQLFGQSANTTMQKILGDIKSHDLGYKIDIGDLQVCDKIPTETSSGSAETCYSNKFPLLTLMVVLNLISTIID